MNEANKERRIAELEFVASAYSSEEAWCEAEANRRDETISNNDNHHGSRVHRRLDLTFEDHTVHVRLTLTLPLDYPMDAPLHVSATVDDSTRINSCPTILVKTVYNALPELAQSCRQAALDNAGEEWRMDLGSMAPSLRFHGIHDDDIILVTHKAGNFIDSHQIYA